MSNSLDGKIVRSKAQAHSAWTDLVMDKGEIAVGAEPRERKPLATFIHMSDLHICDAASPARLEFLDRIADPDSPLSALVPYIGTYRAQEFLTTQVLEAMVAAANEITHGPMSGAPIDAVVITGDVVDNAQSNELNWYKSILDGGKVEPKSGDSEKSEAAHSSNPDTYDIHFYHPDGPPEGQEADRPHTLHGFPHFKGLLAASESAFAAQGLRHKWLAVHGNHDALLQGTAAPTEILEELVTGSAKLAALKSMDDLATLFTGFGEVGPAVYPGVDHLETVSISSDARRKLVTIEEWVDIHTECGHDHGLDRKQGQTAYWYRNIGAQVRLIGLDTVNRFGGWQGCIHREQFEWLRELLKESQDKYVVLSSHHPLDNLFNGYVPDGEQEPALEKEIRELIEQYPNVILWFSGHVHDHKIQESAHADGRHAFWEIRTGSHIDWPQQSRVIEIMKVENDQIVIGTSIIDHAGPLQFSGSPEELADPIALAGFSRLLAANDWQRHREGPNSFESLEGAPSDRNIWLWAHDPLN
jgi:metallophosphoesterase (TIGR03767 family)